jgi:adenine-specific DNA-methyltransferase
VKYHELVPVKSKSLTKKVSLHDNLIIHGDNLKSLKALLPLYAGQIKLVCIDPPYNTGEEKWVYNDNVSSPMMPEWFGKIVDREDLTRHDKWLCMMTPRLKLLKELMSKDGLIAVTIDDNEVQALGMLMNEVFGQENRMACAPWLAEPSGGKGQGGLRCGHNYVLIYHNSDPSNISQEERTTGELNLKDKWGKYRKGRELRKWAAASLRQDRVDMWFALKAPDGSEAWPIRNDGKEGRWRWGRKGKMKEILDDPEKARWEICPYDEGITYDGKTERWVPFEKIRVKKKSFGWSTWLDSYGFNADGTRELKEIFGTKVFDTPKPVSLYEWIVSLHTDENGLVLDSFAGAGTLAHAVLALNNEDETNRRFILIECEDYADSLTAERVRRVIKGVPTAKDGSLKKGLGGTFSFFELGKPIELESILDGEDLPTYKELARYVFYTATGEEFDEKKINQKNSFIGESRNYQVYLFYVPKVEVLKGMAFTLDNAKALPPLKEGKRRLVFAPTKYLDQDHLDRYRIDFAQLPFEIYELTR